VGESVAFASEAKGRATLAGNHGQTDNPLEMWEEKKRGGSTRNSEGEKPSFFRSVCAQGVAPFLRRLEFVPFAKPSSLWGGGVSPFFGSRKESWASASEGNSVFVAGRKECLGNAQVQYVGKGGRGAAFLPKGDAFYFGGKGALRALTERSKRKGKQVFSWLAPEKREGGGGGLVRQEHDRNCRIRLRQEKKGKDFALLEEKEGGDRVGSGGKYLALLSGSTEKEKR